MILAYLIRTWQTLALAAVLILAAFVLGQCDGRASQRAADRAALDRANAAALRVRDAANDIAAAERLRDQQANTIAQEDRLDAINSAPRSRTGDATHALGCVRLLQASGDDAARAAGC